MKTKVLVSLLFISLSFSNGFSQEVESKSKIKWLTINQAFEAIKKEPRKILIDVYTDWCGWCKVMDKNTFSNDRVAEYVNKNYYAVKFNAEQKEEITLGEKKYANGSALAQELLNGQMSYPTIVYLDEKFNMIQPIPGYQDAKAFHAVITFLGTNAFKNEDFDKFKKETYQKKFKDKMPL